MNHISDPNVFDRDHPEKWYLLIETVNGKNIVRAAGSLSHCQKFDKADGTRFIISYLSKEFFLK